LIIIFWSFSRLKLDLDFLLDRSPLSTEAIPFFNAIETGRLQGVISATTVTTIFYLANKILGQASAKKAISQLLQLFEVAAVNRTILENAVSANFSVFENAVLYQTAAQAGVLGIVTRDPKGFKKATLPIYAPAELLKSLSTF
jgi:hypothetical protein